VPTYDQRGQPEPSTGLARGWAPANGDAQAAALVHGVRGSTRSPWNSRSEWIGRDSPPPPLPFLGLHLLIIKRRTKEDHAMDGKFRDV
jgi:hypothetical protein